MRNPMFVVLFVAVGGMVSTVLLLLVQIQAEVAGIRSEVAQLQLVSNEEGAEVREELSKLRRQLRKVDVDLTDAYPRKASIHLITQLFNPTKSGKKRESELLNAIQKNLDHFHIKEIHNLYETELDRNWVELKLEERMLNDPQKKMHHHYVGQRMTYSDALLYANEHLSERVVAITNADIYLGEGFELLTTAHFKNYTKEDYLYEGKDTKTAMKDSIKKIRPNWKNGWGPVCYVLSRWQSPTAPNKKRINECETFRSSHDTFLFMSPVDERMIPYLNFTTSHERAENVVIGEMLRSGMWLKNPCKILRTYHEHAKLGNTHSLPLKGRGGGRGMVPIDHL